MTLAILIFSEGFVPSDRFKGLILMLPANVSIVCIKQLAPNHHHGVFIKQRFNLKVRCIVLLPNTLTSLINVEVGINKVCMQIFLLHEKVGGG